MRVGHILLSLIVIWSLQVYNGLYALAVRDFAQAAKLFLETVSTFTSYELMSYEQVSGVLGKNSLHIQGVAMNQTSVADE